MKRTLLILIFCISKLMAQVNPPDLRCLEVLNNGDVKLTWIPPADPSNQFFSYHIYFSVIRTGTYALLPSAPNAINTTTFVHTGAPADIQSCYYYIVTKYGPTGADSSISSDTLRTIFLNPIAKVITLDITFTHIHKPKLPSSADFYNVLKEYPKGIWNILSVTNNTVYPDTITTCNDSISYQATLMDQSGCSSISNKVVGKYANTKPPEPPFIDSISVLPNGFTVLTWQVPIDKDINQYVIQYNVGGSNAIIDTTSGRNSTSYTYTVPTANSQVVGLYVQSVDSCGTGSYLNYAIRTMYLSTYYNTCSYQSELIWNKYIWTDIKGVPVDGTLEYRIYYSVDGSAFTLVGRTPDTTFVHKNVAPGKHVCYFIRVINKAQTITASSNISCFYSTLINASGFIYIKTATVLDGSSAEIRVLLDNTRASKGISLERSENNIDFQTIGFIPYTGEAHYSFVDPDIESAAKSYYYRAMIIDSCGNPRNVSNKAKTILLKVQEDKEKFFTKQLNWSSYEGFAGDVSGYNIYRIVNGDVNSALIGSTDPLTTHYTDNIEDAASQGSKIEYIVQAVEGIGNPHGVFERSSSNPAAVYMEGELFVPNAFAPQGVNNTWLPVTHFVDKSDYQVMVFNRWGKKVFETSDDTKAWDGENCIADVYVYLIRYKNSRGEYLELKGNVLLLR